MVATSAFLWYVLVFKFCLLLGSYNELFLNQSDNLILLFGVFSPFIFRCVCAQACLTL